MKKRILLSSLKKRKTFNYVNYKGDRNHREYFIVIVKTENHLNTSYVGIRISRKVGASVLRNKVKRQVRHIFMDMSHMISPAYIIFIPKPKIKLLKFSELKNEMFLVLKKYFKNEKECSERGI